MWNFLYVLRVPCPKGVSAIVAFASLTTLCFVHVTRASCPSHQHKTGMMGPCFCTLLRICIRACLSLSVRFYCCRSDGICMFCGIALLFLHRHTWRLPLPFLCKTTGSLTYPCCRSRTLFFLVLYSHVLYPWHLKKHSELFIQ